MKQYAAKLLFQWNPVRGINRKKRRLCEEKIIVFFAEDPESAYINALNIGNKSEYEDNQESFCVNYEFIGILELIDITLYFGDGEVWYEIREMFSPMERKSKIIPNKSELNALRSRIPNRKHHLHYP